MHEAESHGKRWSISLCNCSQDTVHLQYGSVILHIALDDLHELGTTMRRIADGAADRTLQRNQASKKDFVQ